MDVKIAFLNGDLDEEVYMNQPQGFIMPGNENKVCKLIKSLYGLKQAPKQWHQKFDEVVLSNGYLLNQADKCFRLTKEFLSSRFSMKDMGEADVILGIRIKHESNRIAISSLIILRRPNIALVLGITEQDSTCLGLRMMSRLSRKNDMPLQDKPPDTSYPPVGYDVSNLLLRQRIDCCSLNNVSVLPNNTAYSANSIRRTSIQQINTAKAKTRIMAKPAFENNIQSNYDSDNATHELNKKTTIKIGDEFVKILQDNAFNGIDGGDVIDHSAKVLEILEQIKIPNVDKNQLRLHVFLISLSGHAKEWWDNEIKGTIPTWNKLGEKFFQKYYPLSHTCNSKIPDDLDNGTNYLEFLEWPYLDAQEGNGIYNFEESNQYSPPIPVPIDYDVNNPDEVCKSEEFKVIRYSIGTDEEFITISPSKYDTWGKTYGSMSCIYHDLFNKKFRG
ncbi:zinc finger, CCHC-type containing protein [Tanacetum coccineum]